MPDRPESSEQFCVRGTAGGWQPFLPVAADVPVDIPELLIGVPEFLSMTGPGPHFRAAMRAEFPAQQPGQVLVALAEDGKVALVACPQESGAEAYTAMVADLLTIGGRLWRRDYQTFAAEFQQALGSEPAAAIQRRAGAGFQAQAFAQNVEARLRQGRFPVYVVVPALAPEANDAIAYLRSMNMDVKVLGVDTFQSAGIEAAAPTTSVKTLQPGQTRPAPQQPAAGKRPPPQDQRRKPDDRRWFKR